jgi:Flp pilus assembly protein TadD
MSQEMLQTAVKHHQAGRLAEAEALYRQVLVDHPDQADALHLLGMISHQSGREREALELIRRAIEIEPARAEFYSNLSIVLSTEGKLGEATVAVQRALVLRPDFPQALSNLGALLKIANRWDQAIAVYRRWVELRPEDPNGWSELGSSLKEDRQYEQAVIAYRQALQLRHDWVEVYEFLVLALAAAGEGEAALATAREMMERWPDSAEARAMLATGLTAVGKLEEAESACREHVAVCPGSARAHYQLGKALQELEKFDEAAGEYRRAISLDPNHAESHRELGLLQIQGVDLESGFKEFEWRWKKPGLWKSPLAREWNGEPLNGKRIVLVAEGGFGDTLQYARYCPLVAARGGKVILQCQPELLRLLRGVEGVEELIGCDQSVPAHDLYCSLISLPMIFGTTLSTIPVPIRFTSVDPEMARRWGSRLDSEGGGRKRIGLVWAGGPRTEHDRIRSLRLADFAALGQIAAVRFFSLQKGKPAEQARNAPEGLNLIDWTGELADWADTAALVANLDLVISADTAVAHLAGTLGQRIWMLVSKPAESRWMLDRNDSPWYPAMRLFRQKTRGDWSAPMAAVAEELRAWAAAG